MADDEVRNGSDPRLRVMAHAIRHEQQGEIAPMNCAEGGQAVLLAVRNMFADDATSEIYSMLLVEEEGTASTFLALGEVIGEHGLFCALYTDRGSQYFYTSKAGEKVSKTQQTQVGRALSHLGIEHIAAYSPKAPGAPSGCSACCRAGCRRTCGSSGSRRSKSPMHG